MTLRTTTQVTHYHVQKKRRADFIEQWRQYQKTVMALETVVMAETARGTRVGVYTESTYMERPRIGSLRWPTSRPPQDQRGPLARRPEGTRHACTAST